MALAAAFHEVAAVSLKYGSLDPPPADRQFIGQPFGGEALPSRGASTEEAHG